MLTEHTEHIEIHEHPTMKHVNLDPQLELKKLKIMEQFDRGNDPAPVRPPATVPLVEESELRARIIDALKTVYDPEIPVNIYDLGLIYNITIKQQFVDIDMTLTAPGCPVAHTFPGMVERSVALVEGVTGAAVELVWEPAWTPKLISEAARLELGLL